MIQLRQVDFNSFETDKFSFHNGFFPFLETCRCVKGQGMINMRTHDTGDLIIRFDVEFPSDRSIIDEQLKVVLRSSF